MPSPKKPISNASKKRQAPAITEEGREKQLVGLSIDLAEKQILAGTASSQVITHFLKLGSMNNKLELEKLRNENELLKAKADTIKSLKTVEELYTGALNAMKKYSGQGDNTDERD